MKKKIKIFLKRVFRKSAKDKNMFHGYLKSINTIVDVGAHLGSFSVYLNSYYSIKKCLLIEPIPELCDKMRDTFKNDDGFIIINKLVMGDSNDYTLHINEQQSTSSVLDFKDIPELSEINISKRCDMNFISTTLDEVCRENEIESIDLLKIDVQGAEINVLEGGLSILHKTKFIYIELSFKQLYFGSCVFMDVYDFLYKNGFILVDIYNGFKGKNEELLQSDALFKNITFDKNTKL
ncbi:MAG: FkbM family methyltransferase [Bacteroidales bacterium]|nr:FkbM family methyltransferase [Bacteroidales bacterium]